jgi:ribA/ribD-fused uncharacterized protein
MKKTEQCEKSIVNLKVENAAMKKSLCDLQSKITSVECQSRRDNLIFAGIEETDGETGHKSWQVCEDKLLSILKDSELDFVKFERVHRLGSKDQKSKNPRHIIAKFSCYKDRDIVWARRFAISEKSNIWIMEDFPEVIKTNRQKLMPAFKAAKRSQEIKNVSLKMDKLIIDGKVYTVENMNDMPTHLQPENTAVIQNENTLVFFTRHAVFSNLHPLPIKVDGKHFSCNEQFYQYTKAVHFRDFETAQKILNENDPYIMMSLSKTIKNYKHATWMSLAKSALQRANEAKYSQHATARDALIATGTKLLGEASSNKTFGTGVGLLSKFADDPSKWTGQNMMGEILSDIRKTYIPPGH